MTAKRRLQAIDKARGVYYNITQTELRTVYDHMDEQKRKRAVAVLSVLSLCNLAVIFGNSLLSRDDSSKKSSFIASLLAGIFRDADFDTLEHIVRKCAHFFEFFCLGALFICLLYFIVDLDLARTWSHTAFPCLGCLLAASTDEMIQVFTGRGNSVFDVMLDFSGSVTAMCIFFAAMLIYGRVRGGRKKRGSDADADTAPPQTQEPGADVMPPQENE